MQTKYAFLMAIGGVALGAAGSSVLAQNTAPYYLVAEINVKDEKAYEASGVDKVREGMKTGGGKLIAGGYNKATAFDADHVANRVLIFQYPDKATAEKDWKANIDAWEMSPQVRKLADFHTMGVEGVMPK
jgi:uncharacterized protein (DUF1330 family)